MSADAAAAPVTRDLQILVRHHALSMRALGVDFLPVSPSEPALIATLGSDASRLQGELAEPKPLAQPSSAPHPARAYAPLAPSQPVGAIQELLLDAATDIGPPRHPLIDTDPDRARAQKLLDALQARYQADAPHKHFVTDHHTIVFGEGDPKARLVFVGEAPGAEEDKCGRPFVGRAGQLLDKMILAMGLKRQDVYICNVLKTRPPNNATPTLEEAALCAPYLYEQLMIINPVCIVTLGLPASRTLLNSTESMGNLRGQWWDYQPSPELQSKGARPIPVMPTYHPAFLLRSYTKDNRQKVWSDLQQAAAKIGVAPASPVSSGPD